MADGARPSACTGRSRQRGGLTIDRPTDSAGYARGVRLPAVGRATARIGPFATSSAVGWLVAAVLALYIWGATATWNVPDPDSLPFRPLWAGGTLAALLLWLATKRRLSAVAAIALGSVVAMALTDVSYLATQGLRDLGLYLRAGERFLAGQPVYLDALFTTRPADLSLYPFLYPPMTLPVFGLLAELPRTFVEVVWAAGSFAAAIATLRLFGIRWRFVPILFLWPPFFQGLQVGNVAVPLGFLFAIAPWIGAGLVVAAVFKVYSGLAALWLLRERRVVEFIAGVGLVVAGIVVSLPLTGLGPWFDWWRALDLYRQSQPLLADYLYGFGLPRYLPILLVLLVAGLVAVAALRARGREGLARLGLATAVVSPSLFSHGLIVALPSFLALRPLALWSVFAITSVAPGLGWWAAIAVGVAAWFVPALRRRAGEATLDPLDPLDPLGGRPAPWPRDVDRRASEAYGSPLTNVR